MKLCSCRSRAGRPKRCFLTLEQAENEIPGSLAVFGDHFDDDRRDLHAYRCPDGWWHLGTYPAAVEESV